MVPIKLNRSYPKTQVLSSALFIFVKNESHMIKIKPVSGCWEICIARAMTK